MIGKKIVRKKSTILYRIFMNDIKQAEKEIHEYLSNQKNNYVQPLQSGVYKGF